MNALKRCHSGGIDAVVPQGSCPCGPAVGLCSAYRLARVSVLALPVPNQSPPWWLRSCKSRTMGSRAALVKPVCVTVVLVRGQRKAPFLPRGREPPNLRAVAFFFVFGAWRPNSTCLSCTSNLAACRASAGFPWRAGECKYKGLKKKLVAEGASPYPPSKIVKEYGAAAATVCCGGVCCVVGIMCACRLGFGCRRRRGCVVAS